MFKGRQIINVLLLGALAAEFIFMAISSGTTRGGYMDAGNSNFTSSGIAIGTAIALTVIGWGTTLAMPRMSWKMRFALTAIVLGLFAPVFIPISTLYSVVEIGGKDAIRVHKQRTTDVVESTVRAQMEVASQEERLIPVLEPIGNDWQKKAENEAKFGEGSGSRGMGHVTAIKLQIAGAIKTAVDAVKSTKADRDDLKGQLNTQLAGLHQIMSDGYEANSADDLRKNDLKFAAALRKINDLVVKLGNLQSVDLVKAINAQLKAFQGSDRQTDTQGQSDALKDVREMVAATQKIVNELIDNTEVRKPKFEAFTMMSPAQAVRAYWWEINYAWAAAFAMDFIFLPFALFFCVIQSVFERMHLAERAEEEAAAAATARLRQEEESSKQTKHVETIRAGGGGWDKI